MTEREISDLEYVIDFSETSKEVLVISKTGQYHLGVMIEMVSEDEGMERKWLKLEQGFVTNLVDVANIDRVIRKARIDRLFRMRDHGFKLNDRDEAEIGDWITATIKK